MNSHKKKSLLSPALPSVWRRGRWDDAQRVHGSNARMVSGKSEFLSPAYRFRSLISNSVNIKFMNTIRIKIIVSWLLFLSFCLLIGFSWHHRILWLALFLSLAALVQFMKPRPPRAPWQLGSFARFGFTVWLSAVLLHAFYPSSSAFLLQAKIVSLLFVTPVLCYKAYSDYRSFTSAH